jgi:hypothetical protein
MLVVRLPSHGSDILVTLNSPIFISEHSASAQVAGGPSQPAVRRTAGSPTACNALLFGSAEL